MKKITLYRYERAEGGVTVSPIKPDSDYTERYRLVADEGKILTNGDIQTSVIDVNSDEGWEEIDIPEEPEEDE